MKPKLRGPSIILNNCHKSDATRTDLPETPVVSVLGPGLDLGRVRGSMRLNEIRNAAGPMLSLGAVVKLLRINRAGIKKMVKHNQIIAIQQGVDLLFPAFQFANGAVDPGIQAVMQAVDSDFAFSILEFLLTKNPHFDNRTAGELLQTGEVKRVVAEASRFLQHGS